MLSFSAAAYNKRYQAYTDAAANDAAFMLESDD